MNLPDDITDVLHALPDAVNGHGLGFYFEEGGCWGFALAMQQWLSVQNIECQLIVMSDCMHAMVRVADTAIDHQGASRVPAFTATSHASLVAQAYTCGIDAANLTVDTELAQEVIRTACELAKERH